MNKKYNNIEKEIIKAIERSAKDQNTTLLYIEKLYKNDENFNFIYTVFDNALDNLIDNHLENELTEIAIYNTIDLIDDYFNIIKGGL